MTRHGSTYWIAEQLQARGITISRHPIDQHPERVIWESGQPVAFAAPRYQPTRLDTIERMYATGALSEDERHALLSELLETWANETD